jgi:hypothetical protein
MKTPKYDKVGAVLCQKEVIKLSQSSIFTTNESTHKCGVLYSARVCLTLYMMTTSMWEENEEFRFFSRRTEDSFAFTSLSLEEKVYLTSLHI